MSLDFYYGEEIKETAQQVFAGFLQVVSGNSVMPRLVTADNSLEVAKQGEHGYCIGCGGFIGC